MVLIKASDILQILRLTREAISCRLLLSVLVLMICGDIRWMSSDIEAIFVHLQSEIGELIVLNLICVLKAGQDGIRIEVDAGLRSLDVDSFFEPWWWS